MGMTIDETISDLTELKICGVVPFTKGTISGGNYKVITGDCLDEAIETMRKYQMMQADYEARLKADLVAMLEDLRLDCQEAELAGVLDNKELIFADEVDDIIQQRINSLKAESEDT